MMQGRFRILSLDGGGIRGAFAAAFLTELERRSGKRIVDHFDLITGTSTGGLLALGLANGFPASRLLTFYEKEGPAIFPSSLAPRAWRRVAHWYRAKHSGCVLQSTLERLFGADATMADLCTRVVVPSFDVDTGRPVCFKTRHHPALQIDHARRLCEVAMATASAPTYFRPFVSSWGARYVDGGVWANRPAMVGIVEAIRYLGVDLRDIEVLSVGTTGAGYRLRRLWLGGKLPWLIRGRPFDLFMQAGEWSASFQSGLLLPDRLTEVNHQGAIAIPMDDARYLAELRGLGDQKAKEMGAEVIGQFFDAPCSPFAPIPLSLTGSDVESKIVRVSLRSHL